MGAAMQTLRQQARFGPMEVLRSLVVIGILAAIVGQLWLSISVWSARGDASIALNVWNFFSFFTIESNILAMVVLALLVVARLRGRTVGRGLHVVVLCVTTYMIITGIVYNVILRGIELPQGATLGWSNEVLHTVAPLWMLVDWLVSARDRDVRFRHLVAVAIYPLVWLVYTLVRGPITPDQATGATEWYPYPFLYPSAYDSGYGGVIIACLLIAATILAVAALLVLVARLRRRSLAVTPAPPSPPQISTSSAERATMEPAAE